MSYSLQEELLAQGLKSLQASYSSQLGCILLH